MIHEPGEYGGVTNIGFNSSITKSINPADDWDFFTFTIATQYNITVETFGTSGDTVIDLRTVIDEDATIIDYNDDKGGGDTFSKLTFTNLAPGTYYVKVYGWNNNYLCKNYTLYLTASSSAVSDTTAPVITAITPTFSESYGPYGANIDVTSYDAYGIEEVKLFYRVNYGSWSNYSMWKESYNHYLAAIGHFAEGDFVQYYFTAEDSSSNHNERISNNGGLYYNFTVLHNDFTVPIITNVDHNPVAPNETESVVFN